MKLFAAVLTACLVMSVYSQTGTGNAAATTGGASLTGGLPRSGLFGGNLMGLAAMSGQFGDSMQRLVRCQMMGLNPMLCSMAM